LKSPFKKLKEAALSKIIAVLIRKLAEGDFGPTPAKVYWALSGKKTYIAAAIASIAFALSHFSEAGLCEPCAGYVTTLYAVAAFLASIGILDAGIRIRPPQPPIDERFLRR